MTKALQVFSYENREIRTVLIDGEPWLVAKDVCEVLGIQNHKDAIVSLDDDEKSGVAITDPHGREQVTNVINEAGLYKLTFKSRKPAAKKFTRWVTHEVLPTLRKTGSYSVNGQQYSAPANIRAAEVLKNTVQYLSTSEEKRAFTREIYRLVTGQELPKKETAPKAEHTPRMWTAKQIGATLKWPTDAVIHRAGNLGIGHWDGETLCFSKEERTKFLDLVRRGVVRIADGYEYDEEGFKRIHWSFNADAARPRI
jgi:prophage antirepressor-like protein